MNKLFAGTLLFLMLSIISCQRELFFNDDEIPPEPIACKNIAQINIQYPSGDVQTLQPEYSSSGVLTGITDMNEGIKYNISYNSQSNIISITSVLGSTDFEYVNNRLSTINFSYPVESKYEFLYGEAEVPDIAMFYSDKNGSLDLMHSQSYLFTTGQLEIDYDSIGFIKKDLYTYGQPADEVTELLMKLQFGTGLFFGFPEPYSVFSEMLPSRLQSNRYRITTSYAYKEEEGRITEISYSNRNGKVIISISYNC